MRLRAPGRTLTLAAALGLLTAALPSANARLWDALNRQFPAVQDRQVVVVALDDATVARFGPPGRWSAGTYARALTALRLAGAGPIGVLLTRPEHLRAQPGVVFAGTPSFTVDRDGVARQFRTLTHGPGGAHHVTLAGHLARVMAGQLSPTPAPHLLRTVRPLPRLVSFTEVLAGRVPADVQGRMVLIGSTASDAPRVRDATLAAVPPVLVEAQAVESALRGAPQPVPFAGTVLLTAGMAVGAWRLRGPWAVALAMLSPLAALPAWAFGWLVPGVSLSVAALCGALTGAGQRRRAVARAVRTDPVTAVGNRLAFDQALERRWGTRDRQPLGLIVVDLNGFRAANARHGRSAGDVLLRSLAAELRHLSGPHGRLFRWHADKFVLLLEDADERSVARLSEHLRVKLASRLPLGVSVGGAVSSPALRSPAEFVQRAARHHQRHKYTGRDDH